MKQAAYSAKRTLKLFHALPLRIDVYRLDHVEDINSLPIWSTQEDTVRWWLHSWLSQVVLSNATWLFNHPFIVYYSQLTAPAMQRWYLARGRFPTQQSCGFSLYQWLYCYCGTSTFSQLSLGGTMPVILYSGACWPLACSSDLRSSFSFSLLAFIL